MRLKTRSTQVFKPVWLVLGLGLTISTPYAASFYTIIGPDGHPMIVQKPPESEKKQKALQKASSEASAQLGLSEQQQQLAGAVLGGANIYGGSGSVIGTALAALLVGYLQQGLQMVGIPNQVSSALSGALLVVVVMGRSLSLHREWVRTFLTKHTRSLR